MLGRCMTAKYPGVVAANQAAGQGLYPGACKLVGYKTLAGKAAGAGIGSKGLCLGLGLGLGAWAPLLLVGAGIAAGYFIFKSSPVCVASEDKE
ncbi:hypothetical protein [Candidatus Magnetomonas plexicatena]|uniref:hypothetical protein n=1 Tax=Candidatus Magnetomonas plexicatena TaxID=2552947 RepID=UPI001103561B|nr:hypothetical protein E2O03_013545 [Nitrospirales bacterium LBB_01]